MFYYSIRSNKKVIHTETCCCMKRIPQKRIRQFEALEQAYEKHFRLCRYCDPLLKQYRQEKDALASFCVTHPVAVMIQSTGLSISMPFSKWQLKLSQTGDSFELYHKNWQKRKPKGSECVPGYHFQRVKKDCILDYLEYIDAHDSFRIQEILQSDSVPMEKPRKGTSSSKKKKAKRRAEEQQCDRVKYLLEFLCCTDKQTVH